MELRCCDLEVDINGEEIFMVDKKTVSSYSGRLRKLFGTSNSKPTTKNLKLIFHDFPGGPEGFELVLKFCYNNGKTHITPSNISLLHCAAEYMEMNNKPTSSLPHNLLEQTSKLIEEIPFWTWFELLIPLKQYQGSVSFESSSIIVDKCIDSIAQRLVSGLEPSPCPSTSSPDSSGFRFSCDTKSTESTKTTTSRPTWWFEDLLVLSPDSVEKLVKLMASQNVDHIITVKFLLHYQKSKFVTSTTNEKRKIIEIVIDNLYNLGKGSKVIPCKGLWGILQAASGLSIENSSRDKVEKLIGLQLDQVTLDNLLVPSRYGAKSSLYDVNLVLRLLKVFLRARIRRASSSSPELKRVGCLMDLYLSEVAPDPCLKASKFLALAKALPDNARDSYDDMYHAIDMYLEAHSSISKEEKMKIFCALNCEKLSDETCIHLSRNSKFPSKAALWAVLSQQSKLKRVLIEGSESSNHSSLCSFLEVGNKSIIKNNDIACDQVVMYAGKVLDVAPDENVKLKTHLQVMQGRVMELERVCKKMETQVTKITKSQVASSNGHGRSSSSSLPRLCS